MDFVAIDVETANNNVGSICQIGLAKYANGKLIDSYCTLVNPQADFDALNIGIHGITAEQVADAPFIIEVFDEILAFVADTIVVSYTLFDQRALKECLTRYHLPNPNWPWVDATVLVRRTFSQFAYKGYNLANVCNLLNYQFEHHDALADAKACGYVVITILRENSDSIKDYVNVSQSKRSYNRRGRSRANIKQSSANTASQVNYVNNSYPTVNAMQGNTSGRYAGLNICFTGSLGISREEIIELAAKQGFTVKAGASKKLNYLVVGSQDESSNDSVELKDSEKSSKQRKVEALINEGIEIQILAEREFLQLIEKD
ncbi:exonuclease domain-containing protein [Psychrobacter sp. M13]|uniref:exonuclease domain-containing protein n=1 Tax=Psychrobacter sp. M13 TaxID=3067275 RepID=UPI00273B04A4|nr:exonuclease domain-containing protein [Psychrobacter sp. M13]WLP93913.1 exonuclease domain-containing protein [Psychrobacter sp. M13]